MVWMMDSYSDLKGYSVPTVISGKTVALVSSPGRQQATGRRVFVNISIDCQRYGLSLQGSRVAIQGFGQVGSASARLLQQLGAKVIAVSDEKTALYNENGLEINDVLRHRASSLWLEHYPNATSIPRDQLL